MIFTVFAQILDRDPLEETEEPQPDCFLVACHHFEDTHTHRVFLREDGTEVARVRLRTLLRMNPPADLADGQPDQLYPVTAA